MRSDRECRDNVGQKMALMGGQMRHLRANCRVCPCNHADGPILGPDVITHWTPYVLWAKSQIEPPTG